MADNEPNALTYVAWEDLSPLSDEELKHLVRDGLHENVTSPEAWKLQFVALTKLQQAVKHHPSVLVKDGFLNSVIDAVIACCGSLRSSLAKNAFLTLCALAKRPEATSFVKCLLGQHSPPVSPKRSTHPTPRLRSVFSLLLNKASSTAEKRFINLAAEECINSIVVVPELMEASINFIYAALNDNSKNSRLMIAGGNALLHAWRAEAKPVSESMLKTLSHASAALLNDRLPASRQAGRALLEEISEFASRDPKLQTTVNSVWKTKIQSPSLRSAFTRALPELAAPRRCVSSISATRTQQPFLRSAGASFSATREEQRVSPLRDRMSKQSATLRVRSRSHDLQPPRDLQITIPPVQNKVSRKESAMSDRQHLPPPNLSARQQKPPSARACPPPMRPTMRSSSQAPPPRPTSRGTLPSASERRRSQSLVRTRSTKAESRKTSFDDHLEHSLTTTASSSMEGDTHFHSRGRLTTRLCSSRTLSASRRINEVPWLQMEDLDPSVTLAFESRFGLCDFEK